MKNSLRMMGLLVLFAAAFAEGAPTPTTVPGRIRGSKHDLSTLDQSNQRAEICVYCHTPHNTVEAVPLWNRNNPSAYLFRLYNSPTLSSVVRSTRVMESQSISLFCMSCHDGITAMGDVKVNPTIPSQRGAVAQGIFELRIPQRAYENPGLGFDLKNSHPIAFDYNLAYEEDDGLNPPSHVMTAFNALARTGATKSQNFLYGLDSNMFECASCHRVHDPGSSGNFLRIENDHSQLCFACHNK
ncbi:cytochrome c3 family protein [Geobacter sp. DSM 9736]|uniref:cytochrome c3 family protein n=1 Tax=Geobacter sp. DSM 9736 TaxID=1277350 RepID=UPI000B503E6D|nr:cytochrome c3 family protein [Geobacter sp. DSM 9736]SNB45263.1 doubled CXXCH domain-containing protein [Geobacter sp. DSM 9736]